MAKALDPYGFCTVVDEKPKDRGAYTPGRSNAERIEKMLADLDPAAVRDEWFTVAQACKEEGVDYAAFDAWSARDPEHYDERENRKRWDSIKGTPSPVSMGTLVNICKANGVKIVTSGTAGGPKGASAAAPKPEPKKAPASPRAPLTPVKQAAEFIRAVFEPGEFVGIENASDAPDKRGKFGPDKNPRFAERDVILKHLKAAADAGSTELADGLRFLYPHGLSPHGVFVCANPMDGKGRRANANLTGRRHLVIEGDEESVESQLKAFEAMGLPCTAITESGNKSIHGLVRVDAKNDEEYHARFDLVAGVCKAHGLTPDKACSNPTRLTRLPGAVRDGKPQRLIATDEKASWDGYVASVFSKVMPTAATRGLAIYSLQDAAKDPAPVPAPVIGWPHNYFCKRHQKTLVSAASKFGKSQFVLTAALCVAGGIPFMGWPTVQGRVLYLNLENDPGESQRRFFSAAQKVADTMDGEARDKFLTDVFHNLMMLDLDDVDMTDPDEYVGAVSGSMGSCGVDFDMVVLDPFYAWGNPDENDAQEVGRVFKGLGKLMRGRDFALVVVHHFSKGSKQYADNPDSMASGSGVFQRHCQTICSLLPVELKGPAYDDACAALGVTGEAARFGRAVVTMRDGSRPDFNMVLTPPVWVYDGANAVPASRKENAERNAQLMDAGRRATVRDAYDACIEDGLGMEHEGRTWVRKADMGRKYEEQTKKKRQNLDRMLPTGEGAVNGFVRLKLDTAVYYAPEAVADADATEEGATTPAEPAA